MGVVGLTKALLRSDLPKPDIANHSEVISRLTDTHKYLTVYRYCNDIGVRMGHFSRLGSRSEPSPRHRHVEL